MKNIFVPLFFLLILIGCTKTPETQIKESFYNQYVSTQRFQKNVKIKNVYIYDTIYVNEIYKKIDSIDKEINNLQKNILKFNITSDSIYKLYNKPYSEKRKMLNNLFDKKRYVISEINYLYNQKHNISKIDFQRDGHISAYYAEIITNKDTLHFIVSSLTYTIIYPTFMIE